MRGAILLAVLAAAAQDPPSIERAYRLLETGRPADAQRMFLQLHASDPGGAAALEGLVWTRLKLGDPRGAAEWADRRRALDPSSKEWREVWLTVVAQVPERRGEAIEEYAAVLRERPDDHAARLRRAQLLAWSPGRLREAVAEYREILRRLAGHREARLGLARTLSWMGEIPAAAREYDALLARDSKDLDALIGRAQTARWSGKHEEAARFRGRAASVGGNDPRVLVEFARARLDAGRRSEALEYAARAVRRAPDLYEAREALREAEEAVAPRFALKASASDEEDSFDRATVAAQGELYPGPDLRWRVEALASRFERDAVAFDRLTFGTEVRPSIHDGGWASASYRRHEFEGIAATHEFAVEAGVRPPGVSGEGRIGVRRRAVIDAPRGYEEVAYLEGVGSGGSTVEGLVDRIQILELFGSAAGSPFEGSYAYADGAWGEIDDDNRRLQVAAGFGVDMFRLFGGPGDHSLTATYDYFFLQLDEASPAYFSPSRFQVHAPGLDWRWRVDGREVAGLHAGVPLRPDESPGYRAGAFLRLEFATEAWVQGRFLIMDDTEFRTRAVTLAVEVRF